MKEKSVMVSIWCLTYNHKDYIKDAIAGCLNQRTNFPYEILVHDDASTDGTAEIIREYESKYPDIIKGIYQKENLYCKSDDDWHGKKSFLQKVSKGKYIALCEGDDCWTDSNKLQMQVDYMESHSDCVMTAHDAIMIDTVTGERKRISPYLEEGDISSDEIIMQYRGNLPTASIMYKREMMDMRAFFANVGVGDYPLQLYCLTQGKIHYFTHVMSMYRYVGTGAWTSKLQNSGEFLLLHYVKMIRFMEQYDHYTGCKYTDSVTRKKRIYLQYILNRFQNYTGRQFQELSDSCNRRSNLEFTHYFEEIDRIFVLLHEKDVVDESIQAFIKQYSHIVIWGAGEYGKIVANRIQNEEKFEGFVISGDQEIGNGYLGKPVWRIHEMPFNVSETGIIVGVRFNLWNEVHTNIEDITGINYYYPFDLHMKNCLNNMTGD